MDPGPSLSLTQMHELLVYIEYRACTADGRPAPETFIRLSAEETLGIRRIANLLLKLTPHAARVREMTEPRERRAR